MTSNAPVLDWVPDLLGFVRRSAITIAASCALCLSLGVAYTLLATPRYTASSSVLVDVQASAPFRQQAAAVDSQYANGIAESQAEVLQSPGLARDVVRALKLADDPIFLENGHSLASGAMAVLLSPFTRSIIPSKEDRDTNAADLLGRMIRVHRVGISFILELDVTSHSAELSTRLANALVDAFAESGLNARSGNTIRASQWMQGRIGDLQSQAETADQAVQAFKAQSGIVDTDKGLMNERQLGELNSQLVLARARVADSRARLDRIRQVMDSGGTVGDVSDALQNAVITHLREQYVDVARQSAEWAAHVGREHASVHQANARLQDIEAQIRLEMKRVADGTESDNLVAVANQKSIETQLAALVADADRTNVDLVKLRALQSRATIYNTLYADFLQRYTQAVQDQSFPVSDIRIVTRAAVPPRQSWPKALVVLAATLVIGIMIGFSIAMVRDALDKGLRQASDVRERLGLPCLGVLPRLKLARVVSRARKANGADRLIVFLPPILRHVILQPFSPFAEVIRGLRTRLNRSREGRPDANVIGFVSAMPGEGKSTVSANFAFFLAQAGMRTLLVDADLRRHTLSRLIAPQALSGIAEITAGTSSIEQAVWREPISGLAFLPSAAASVQAHGPDASIAGLGGPLTSALLLSLREQFDMIVVDLPAISPVADAAVATSVMSGVVMVVEWGETSFEVVQECLENAGIAPQRLLGVVLNKARPEMRRYDQGKLGTVPASPSRVTA